MEDKRTRKLFNCQTLLRLWVVFIFWNSKINCLVDSFHKHLLWLSLCQALYENSEIFKKKEKEKPTIAIALRLEPTPTKCLHPRQDVVMWTKQPTLRAAGVLSEDPSSLARLREEIVKDGNYFSGREVWWVMSKSGPRHPSHPACAFAMQFFHSSCYGLNYVPPKFICWSPNPQWTMLRARAFKEATEIKQGQKCGALIQ